MSIRAKMRLDGVIPCAWGGFEAVFSACYDDQTEENKRFQKATPTASAHFKIDNPEATKHLVIGEYYYFDIAKVPSPAPVASSRTITGAAAAVLMLAVSAFTLSGCLTGAQVSAIDTDVTSLSTRAETACTAIKTTESSPLGAAVSAVPIVATTEGYVGTACTDLPAATALTEEFVSWLEKTNTNISKVVSQASPTTPAATTTP